MVQADHVCGCKGKAETELVEAGQACLLQCCMSSNKVVPPPPNNVTYWGPSVQTPEPMGDISHLTHRILGLGPRAPTSSSLDYRD